MAWRPCTLTSDLHARSERRAPSVEPIAARMYARAAMAATILIVEDEHAVARGIQYALQQEGYQVAVARSGEEGLDFARKANELLVLSPSLTAPPACAAN